MQPSISPLPQARFTDDSQPTPADGSLTDLVQFINTLYQGQSGWLEIDIAMDPSCKTLQRVEWCYYEPGSAPTLAYALIALAHQHGNVYISGVTFTQKQRSQSYANASMILFIDDAPPREDYSLAVQTSDQSRHAYYRLDQRIPIAQRVDLQRRAAAALGADPSGADAEQLVRIPGSVNTKYDEPFAVRLCQSGTSAIYSVPTLESRWPSVLASNVVDMSLDMAEVEFWLGNMDALLEQGIPRRFCKTPDNYSRQVLDGRVKGKSRSEDRQAVATGLVIFGYPNDVAAALLIHCCDYGRSQQKGRRALLDDVVRCLQKARGTHPDQKIRPVQRNAPRPPRPLGLERPAGKGGANQALSWQGLLAFYADNVTASQLVLMSVAEVAKLLGVSKDTVKRRERELRKLGLIERGVYKGGKGGFVRLLNSESTQDGDLADDESTGGRITRRGGQNHTARGAESLRNRGICTHSPAHRDATKGAWHALFRYTPPRSQTFNEM